MNSQLSSQSTAPVDSPTQPQWWQKPLIWGGFLALLYLLREFFLIGFLTFLLCFIVRTLVGFFSRRITPNRENRALELTLTLAIFLAICLVLYGLGRYYVPKVIREGKSLATQLQNTSPADVQNSLLANTVGNWQFQRQFGLPQDPRYQKAFAEYQEAGRSGEGLFHSFPKLNSRLQAEFEANYERAHVQHLQSPGPERTAENSQFQQWVVNVEAPKLFKNKSDYYIARWQAGFTAGGKASELATLKQRSDFESVRDEQIRHQIWADIENDPVQLAQLQHRWASAESTRQWAEFRKSTQYQQRFKSYYQTQRNDNPAAAPIDYAFFQTLSIAYPKGKPAFLDAVRQHFEKGSESLEHQKHDFETARKLELGQQWWATSHAADWVRDHAKSDGPKVLKSVVGWFDGGLSHLVRVPVQIATSLVLAIFILIEWHGMKNGVANLRDTRLRPIYDEVVPGIVALGKLIGKSFQGQAVIALFNATFTLIALWLIGVEYKFVLALIVFVFSFIPTIGVILSAIPICAVALFQPGGSIVMVLQVVAAIVVIHLIEGMILSPRIIGKIGHLHPVLVIGILLVAEHFFGLWGLILGIPVAIYLIRVVLLNKPIAGVYEPPAVPVPQ